jgi:hypothetical protein
MGFATAPALQAPTPISTQALAYRARSPALNATSPAPIAPNAPAVKSSIKATAHPAVQQAPIKRILHAWIAHSHALTALQVTHAPNALAATCFTTDSPASMIPTIAPTISLKWTASTASLSNNVLPTITSTKIFIPVLLHALKQNTSMQTTKYVFIVVNRINTLELEWCAIISAL